MTDRLTGHPVTIDGREVRYLVGSSDLAAVQSYPAWNREVLAHFRHHPRFRGVVYAFGHSTMLLLLRWNDGTDLDAVDRRVASNSHTPQDFATCVPTYVGRQRCRACDVASDVVLPDPGVPPSSPERWRGHPTQTRCPHCGQETLSYLELLD